MQTLILLYAWFSSHPAAVALAVMILSAAIDQMPAPASTRGFYVWLYGFAHVLLLHTDKFHVSLAGVSAPAPAIAPAPPAAK